MARPGMGDLIARTRRLVNDTAMTIWQDDDLQQVLDLHKQRVEREPLESERTRTGPTTAEYRIYHSRHGNLEAGGTPTFRIEDSTGTQRGTADYAVDYVRGVVTMAADQQGTALYLTGWTYDLNAAAADLWRERAGALAERVDIQTGNNRLSRGQQMKHALDMAAHYERQARPRIVRGWTVGILDHE